MEVLIVGGDSVIGSALFDCLSTKSEVYCDSSTRNKDRVSSNRPYIDLNNIKTFFLKKTYDVAIICAGISNIEFCENNSNFSRKINVDNTFLLAKNISANGCLVALLSSNAVFDGKKPFMKSKDEKGPYTEYGIQKSLIEDKIMTLNRYTIIRMSKVLHKDMPLHKKWIDQLRKNESIEAFSDMMISPVYIESVIDTIVKSIFLKENKIVHCEGDPDLSYCSYAKFFVKLNGYSDTLVSCVSGEFKVNFKPPKYTSLSN
jgi:dTDP-4-dehydrorhamnose reductase